MMNFNIKNCVRTAAIICADGNDHAVKKTNTIKKYIEAVFTLNENNELSSLDLISQIENDYKISFTEVEIQTVIKECGNKVFQIFPMKHYDFHRISLTQERYQLLLSRDNSLNLQAILSDFASECNISYPVNFLEALIYKYLYHLLNTNVSAVDHNACSIG